MKQRNRGKAPNDDLLFSAKFQTVFYDAIRDMSYLLTRGYGSKSSLQIVGNRYRLNARQQKALLGMSASESSISIRKKKKVQAPELYGKEVVIDGFNLLIILESAMSGAYIFKGQDEAYRDVTSVHGGYKRVIQTESAILLVGYMLKELGVTKAIWYLDAPISNSGRLKTHLREVAEREDFNWDIQLANNPDKALIASKKIIISADAWVIEEGTFWFNAMGYLLRHHLKDVHPFLSEKQRKIAVVTCVKKKLESPNTAKQMYQGDLFPQLMDAARAIPADEILILSGKYHLLELDQIIEPYDLNLNLQNSHYRKQWAIRVLTQLEEKANLDHDLFYFYTSKGYYEHLIPYIQHYRIPLEIH